MKFKLPNDLLVQAGKHAAERGMTLEEYIEEFLTLVKERGLPEQKVITNPDGNDKD